MCTSYIYYNFNPRSLTGATTLTISSAILANISIHAPSRERQQAAGRYHSLDIHFNPRSLTGATACARFQSALCWYFNPRSLTGATLASLMLSRTFLLFQSTLPHGSDFHVILPRYHLLNFNPRSLTGATRC